MAQRGRPGLSPEQKRELWRRWKAGESLSEIGRALGKQAGSIHGVVAANGGYVPAPADGRRGCLAGSSGRRSPAGWPMASRSGRSPVGPTGALDDQPRDRPPRRPRPVSRDPGGRAGVAAGPATEACSSRPRHRSASSWRPSSRRTGRPSRSRAGLPGPTRGAGSSGVDRDDLPQPVRPGPRRAQEGADRAPADPTHHAPLEAGDDEGPGPGRHRRTPSRSVSARPRSKTVRSPATGRAICSPAPPTPTSPPSSSARPAT